MSPEVITAIGTAGAALIAALVGAYTLILARRLTVQGKGIHTLVNSAMGTQLRISALQAKRLAELTKEPGDLSLAEEAARLLSEHEKKTTAP